MKKIDLSIIVLTYNATLEAIMLTLQSIIEQEFEGFEVIIADDGSEYTYFTEIKEYLESENFKEFKILESKVNVGTVKNYIRGIELADGKYIKPIGAGDLFYDKTVFARICSFMRENECKCGFGLMVSYQKSDNSNFYKRTFKAPVSIRPYVKHNLEKIKRNVVFHGDYISGATLFGEKDFLLKYLFKIEGRVRLTEDVIQVLILLDNQEIGFLKYNIIFYEFGSGISTKKSNNTNQSHMSSDFERFWYYIQENYTSKKISRRSKVQITLLNETNRVRRNCLSLRLNNAEFLINQIRKYWKKQRRRIMKEGFLGNKRFIRKMKERENRIYGNNKI